MREALPGERVLVGGRAFRALVTRPTTGALSDADLGEVMDLWDEVADMAVDTIECPTGRLMRWAIDVAITRATKEGL